MRWGNYDTVHAATRGTRARSHQVSVRSAMRCPALRRLPNSFYLSPNPRGGPRRRGPRSGPDISGGADATGHVYKIPAHACYDTTSKTGGILNFNAVNCYPDTTAPTAPTHLRIAGE